MYRDEKGRFCKAPLPVLNPENNMEAGKKAIEEIVDGGLWKEQDECSYGIVYKDGHVQKHLNDVCHARMRIQPGHGVAVSAFDLPHKEGHKKEQLLKWFHFMANEGLFRDIILTKDPEYMYKYGVVFDVDKPYSQVVTAAVALRLCTEYPDALSNFVAHYDKGCYSPGMLLLLTFCTCKGGKMLNSFGYGHSCFSTLAPVDETRQWMLTNTLPPCGDRPFHTGMATYYLFRTIWPSAEKWGFPERENLQQIISRIHGVAYRAFGEKKDPAANNTVDAFVKFMENK